MPRKIRELIRDLERAGYERRGGRGSHRKFKHPDVNRLVVLSGQLGADAKSYQEKVVKTAVQEAKK